MFLIKNISQHNIAINNNILKPDGELFVNEKDINLLSESIKSGLIEIFDKNDPVFIQTMKVKFNVSEFLNINNITEALFKLYLNNDLTKEEIELLKMFYKKISYTNNISNETLTLLNNVETREDLIVVLLNHIYYEFIIKFFK